MSSSSRTLLVNAEVYSSSDPFATAVMIDDGAITWVGDDAGARVHTDVAGEVVDLQGAFLAPGFVDSHIHATSSGLRLVGVDLSDARHSQDVLDAVTAHATDESSGLIYGHGWDETMWADSRLPLRHEIDAAAKGRHVYLSRIDVHSALVSTSLVDRCPDIDRVEGFSSHGAVAQRAHHLIREYAFEQISVQDRRDAQLATLSLAASIGVVAVHEMGGPTIGGAEDLRTFLEVAADNAGPKVTGYWGQLASEGGIELAREIGARGVGGDLFVDGSLGSHTAALHEPYCDAADTRGVLYLSEDDIADHLVEATRAGMQAGFHVIGDAACAAVAAGFRRAASIVGDQMLRARRHRLEHAEMLSDADIATVIDLGGCVSMQPMFDELWGVPDGM
ncbi:MAG: amidohydrolase family protein, partial [Actinomycetota bacterium]|nr:amidohydrolase family protein [Actinomycetota bacterium]